MLFSIVTVTLNAKKALERTVNSVLEQSFRQIEHVIIDGGSTDGTTEMISDFNSQLSILNSEILNLKYLSERDNGIYDAMNKALRIATGDYVWFLNAGDALKSPSTVADVAAVCEANNLPDVIYGETDLTDANGRFLAPRRLKAPTQLNWRSFRFGMLVCHQAFIVKRSLAPEYNVNYRFSADFDWCIRCLKNADTVVNTGLRLVNYQYEGATTANRWASLKERYNIMCAHYGAYLTILRHLWFAIRFYWSKMFRTTI
jgi:glycosyltransferase involved in cell wall biosynthesis